MNEQIESGYELPVFLYRRPAELDGSVRRVPVVIAGGGLAGLTLAADLSVRGVPFVLLDEDDTIGVRGASSRGIVYGQKSLEIFDRLGIWDRLAAKGVAWSVGRSLRGESEVIYEFDAARQTASVQPPFLNIQQFYVEWYLVDRIQELNVGELRWRNKVLTTLALEDHCELEIETPDGIYRLQCDWLVDCTGLASRIREGLGLPTYPEKGTERWCISDVRFEKELPLERWTWVESPANDGRAVWQHPMADGVWRVDFQMELDADADYISRPDVCAARVRSLLGDDVPFKLVWVGPWVSRTHLLENFRHKRVLFAGDAAHVFPPLGGRGGNSGIQDADNLGWKLTMVIQGQASSGLLDSYNAERRPAAIHNTRLAARSVRFLSPVSPGQRRIRTAAMDLARHAPFARSLINTGRLSDPFCYRDSPLSPGAGESIANLPLRLHGKSTTLMNVARATRLIVLTHGEVQLPSALAGQCVLQLGPGATGDVADTDGCIAAELGLREGDVMVLRPDLHVLVRGNASTDAAALKAAVNLVLDR